jgi:DNA repair protein RecO (recombination protein O)
MGEVLNKTIQAENQSDKNLFDFLYTIIQYLDLTQQSLANFPIYFMLQLSQYLGFNPKLNYNEINDSFDLQEGVFKPSLFGDIKVVESNLAAHWFELCKVNLDSFSQIEINKNQRHELLDHVMLYFKIHMEGFNELKSNKVLVEVLA